MDVTVLFKWGYDPDDAYVSSDGQFKWKRGKLVASDDDAAAMASARKLAEATDGTLTGVTIGDGDRAWAAARGAGFTCLAAGLGPTSDDRAQAEGLCRAIKSAKTADVVAMGDSIERAGVAPALAAMLGVPYVASVRDFGLDPDDPDCILAHRAVDGGMMTVRFKTPVLVSVEARDSEKNVPGMKQVLAAKRSPVEELDVSEPEDGAFSAVGIRKAESHRARLFEGSPDEAANGLVSALKSDGVL